MIWHKRVFLKPAVTSRFLIEMIKLFLSKVGKANLISTFGWKLRKEAKV